MILSIIQSLFRSERQYKLFMIMCLSTLFDISLVIYRIVHTHFDTSELDDFYVIKITRGVTGTFLFLVWNLFLAWVPYWFALSLDFATRMKPNLSAYSVGLLLVMWLLFFPNAPYIITDLLHLKDREVVPHWFDLMMIVSFAWTGLMLGYCSLFEIQHFLEQRYKPWIVWSLIGGAIWIAGFGVYMGRFQRWNSWDAFTHPFSVIGQQIHVLLNFNDYLGTLGMAVVLSGFMFIGYLTLDALRAPAKGSF
jgi:uncharacterized membrane protein